MNFAFVVVCKVPNSFAKSKNSPTPRDFVFRLSKPKVWTPPLIFFHRSRVFFLRAILTYVVRAIRRPGQFVVHRRRRSRQFADGGHARQLEGGRARAARRADGRREIARGGGDGVRRGRPKL